MTGNERTEMSTKKTLKRIALVAVSALGFGLLSVVPAGADATVTVAANGFACVPAIVCTTQANGAVVTAGQTTTVEGAITTENVTDTDYLTYTIGVVSEPATSTLAAVAPATGNPASGKFSFITGSETSATGWTLSTTTNLIRKDVIGATAGNLSAAKRFKLAVTPTVPGNYSINLTVKTFAADNSTDTDLNRTLTFYFTVNAEVTVAQVTSITTALDTGKSNSVAVSASTARVVTVAYGAVTKGTSDTITLRAAATTKPAGSVATMSWAKADADTAAGGTTFTPATPTGLAITGVFTANATADSSAMGTLTFAGDTAGSYTITVWHDQDRAGDLDASEQFQTYTVTVSSASSGTPQLADFKNAASTDAGVNSSNAGLYVPTVGVTQTTASGRTGTWVGFAPNYIVKNYAGAGTSTNLNLQAANLQWTIANPAGTAVTSYTAISGLTSIAEQYVQGASATLAHGVAQTTSNKGTPVYFNPATAGVYTITVWHDANRDDLVTAGEAQAQLQVTIVADAVPSIKMTVYGQAIPAAATNNGVGQLMKIELLNGTAKASLGENETLTLTGPTGTVFDKKSALSGTSFAMADAGDGTSVALTRANFNGSGVAYVNFANSTAAGGTFTITASISGGTASGASGSVSHTMVDTSTYAADRTSANTNKAVSNVNGPTSTLTRGVKGATLAAIADATGNGGADAAGAATWYIKPGVATTVAAKYTVGAVNAKSFTGKVVDTLGLLTGMPGAEYTVVKTTAKAAADVDTTTAVTFSVAVPALASTQTNAVDLVLDVADAAGNSAVTRTITISTEAAAATYCYVNAAQDSASLSLRVAAASTNKLTAVVNDQFGNAFATNAVTAAISGRNSATVVAAMVPAADGSVSFSLADTYVGTVLLTDTVTFTAAAGITCAVTLNYAAYNAASTITLTTPDSATATATGIAGTVTSDIDAGAYGASNKTATVSAVLKDAAGATLPAGVAVTFSVSGNDGAAILSTAKTVYTDADGKASTSVYAWLNGNATVTATAGAATASGIVYFKQADCTAGSECAEARTVAATSSGNVVTAIVKDRYGNPIKGVTLTATRVGTGSFAGSSSTTGTTDKNGSVDFVLTGGTADVTIAFSSATFGQTEATKGYVDAGITALDAYVAGTSATAEEGVGASYDAAGINSVTVKSVADTAAVDAAAAAADAAVEAIDAANAATDAANLAAEAADAATVAAEEARDAADAATAAVEELATQVATLMAALKAQITTLANTVAKIAKKVKA
jgi:hypothetical protein